MIIIKRRNVRNHQFDERLKLRLALIQLAVIAIVLFWRVDVWGSPLSQTFYKDIKIVAVASAPIGINAQSGYSLSELPSQQKIEAWAVEIFKGQIKVHAPIQVVTVSSSPEGTYVDGKSEDSLYFYLDMKYWDKKTFSPELNHSVLSLSASYKRTLPQATDQGKIVPVTQEKHVPAVLISLPEDRSQWDQAIKNALDSIAGKITPYINCSNQGICKKSF